MKTKSIRVEEVGKGIRAYIIIQTSRGDVYQSTIEYPFSSQPYYFLDGKRHELKEHEIRKLKETIKEVRDGR